jgi:uncharacterized protein (TIGR01244 family)
MRIVRLDDEVSVAGQVAPDEMEALRSSGIAMIVNNRPDGEEPGQPAAAAIEAAATAAGIGYRFIPVRGAVSEAQIIAMADALRAAQGPVVAFCRSGTRSTFLWALARARIGDEAEALIAKAAAAGFNLAPIQGFLDDR